MMGFGEEKNNQDLGFVLPPLKCSVAGQALMSMAVVRCRARMVLRSELRHGRIPMYASGR